jgi:thiamine biosynthesis lipoprotein
MQYHEFRAMNTKIVLAAECDDPAPVFARAQRFVEGCEERFSRFRETSELSALNRSAGEWFSVSPDMLELLIEAVELHQATRGIFDPAILPDLRAAGYTRSFEQLAGRSADPVTAQVSRLPRIPFSAIAIDSLRGQVYLPKGMQVDLGGIAKGWIAEKAARRMALSCTACAVNTGGDMFLIGLPAGQSAWEIGLEDPNDPNLDLMVLQVESGAVATSSVVKRRWRQGESMQHHLIDPRTGKPAETPWLSVTAFAPTAVQAETFAKAILIAGPQGAEALLEDQPEISFLAVDSHRQIWKSPTEVEKIYEYV